LYANELLADGGGSLVVSEKAVSKHINNIAAGGARWQRLGWHGDSRLFRWFLCR
jgi:hypothetical protein